jgi:hypothetical protein
LTTEAFEAPAEIYPVLDAPHAAAAIALCEGDWAPDLERMIRICRAFDTAYFEDAFLRAIAAGWIKRSIGNPLAA